MVYKGVIIEESLEDRNMLKQFKIIKTRVEKVTKFHKTPRLKQWTLRVVKIPDSEAGSKAQLLSRNVDKSHKHPWYIDYMDKTTHYIIFSGKIFKVNRQDSGKEYYAVRDYGIMLGIPAHQLDFSFCEIR